MTSFEQMKQWIEDLTALISNGSEPESHFTINFLRSPELGLALIDLLDSEADSIMETSPYYFSALIFALDVCVAQFQNEAEAGVKSAQNKLGQLMDHLAKAIAAGNHSLSYWMPVLNSFYDVHVEVTDSLREAYLTLASFEEESIEEIDPVLEIREMIAELSDLSDYDIAENFFSQSHAMPPEFFAELIIDLYSVPEGEDIALLCLLHPNREVREVVVTVFDTLIHEVRLSSRSLSRLKAIKDWYPYEIQKKMEEWLKIQRKKEVVYLPGQDALPVVKIKATEVDGSGAQGLFIQFKSGRKSRLCGLLFKLGYGIKDTWITSNLSKKEIESYYKDAFDSEVTLREVELDYLKMMGGHFMAINRETGNTPNLYFLELEELMGFHFHGQWIDKESVIQTLGVQISPFTHESMELSFKRSKSWLTTKSFTETWYMETAEVDKLVNRFSSFENGIRLCNIEEAIDYIIEKELEMDREAWIFHFLWVTLWLKSHYKKNDRSWQDSFFIVYALETGYSMAKIPVMYEIAKQTVINSVETMQDRRTHLSTQ